MNLISLDRARRQLRLSGMAAVLDTRRRQAENEKMAPIDLVSTLVADELRCVQRCGSADLVQLPDARVHRQSPATLHERRRDVFDRQIAFDIESGRHS